MINSDLHNFGDDNTIAATCNNLTSPCQTLEKESEPNIEWFKNNNMIANPGNFQAIILSKDAPDVRHELLIYDNEIETTKYSGTSLKRTSSKANTSLRQTKNFVLDEFLRNPL